MFLVSRIISLGHRSIVCYGKIPLGIFVDGDHVGRGNCNAVLQYFKSTPHADYEIGFCRFYKVHKEGASCEEGASNFPKKLNGKVEIVPVSSFGKRIKDLVDMRIALDVVMCQYRNPSMQMAVVSDDSDFAHLVERHSVWRAERTTQQSGSALSTAPSTVFFTDRNENHKPQPLIVLSARSNANLFKLLGAKFIDLKQAVAEGKAARGRSSAKNSDEYDSESTFSETMSDDSKTAISTSLADPPSDERKTIPARDKGKSVATIPYTPRRTTRMRIYLDVEATGLPNYEFLPDGDVFSGDYETSLLEAVLRKLNYLKTSEPLNISAVAKFMYSNADVIPEALWHSDSSDTTLSRDSSNAAEVNAKRFISFPRHLGFKQALRAILWFMESSTKPDADVQKVDTVYLDEMLHGMIKAEHYVPKEHAREDVDRVCSHFKKYRNNLVYVEPEIDEQIMQRDRKRIGGELPLKQARAGGPFMLKKSACKFTDSDSNSQRELVKDVLNRLGFPTMSHFASRNRRRLGTRRLLEALYSDEPQIWKVSCTLRKVEIPNYLGKVEIPNNVQHVKTQTQAQAHHAKI